VGRLSVAMWIVVLGTVLWITISGVLNFDARRALDFPPGAFTSSRARFAGRKR